MQGLAPQSSLEEAGALAAARLSFTCPGIVPWGGGRRTRCSSLLKQPSSRQSRNGNPMLHELRIYTVVPGRLVDTVNRYRDHALRLFERHGIRNVGRWPVPPAPTGLRLFTC